MDKSIWKSKTLWGFGLAAIIALAQVLGIGASETAVASIVQILTLLFGGYGLRDAAAPK